MKNEIQYFIYVRKSSEGEDRQMLSIDGQLNELKKLVNQNSFTVIDTFIESGSAHKPENRPKFRTMMNRIDKGEGNGIICWHVNRLSRNPIDSARIQWSLQQAKTRSIITPYRNYKSEDNALLFSIETSEANQYSRDLSINVKRGLRQKIEMGWPPGSAPLGYLNTKSSIRGSNMVLPDSERWPILRKAFDLLLSGAYTTPKIVDIVNNEYGLKTRPGRKLGSKPISRSTLYRIFTDPFYYGYFYRKGILYKGAYSAMITVDEFDRVQQILGRKGKARPKRHIFQFTGLMKCGACNASITATRKVRTIKKTGESKTYCFYHCTKRKKGILCPVIAYTPEAEMEKMIVDELGKYEIRPVFKQWALEIQNENFEQQSENHKKMIEIQRKTHHKIQKEIDQILEMRIADEISAEVFQQKKNEKEALLLRVQSTLEKLQESNSDFKKILEEKLNFLSDITDKFNNSDINERKEICHRFGWNWVLKDKKIIVDKHLWLDAVKNYKEAVNAKLEGLEPEKTFSLKGYNDLKTELIPIVRTLVDEVRKIEPDIPVNSRF